MSQFIVYTHHLSNRVKYAFKLFFYDVLQTKITVTDNLEAYETSGYFKINYSHNQNISGFQITPHGLLQQKGVSEQKIKVENDAEFQKVFFQLSDGDIHFDIIAASFYLVSRYEEYLPHKKDAHNRYDAKESLAFKQNFLSKPLVNIWAEKLKEKLISHDTNITFPQKKYTFISTIDVDNAYAYLEKGIFRTLGAVARDVLKLDLESLKLRTKCFLKITPDPFDTYDYLIDLHKRENIKAIYFFLVADYGLNDKNVPVSSRKLQSLIKHLGDYSQIALHPSYASASQPEKLKTELERLEGITNRKIDTTRQHFLRLTIPGYFRNLIKNEIFHDHTMGYASELGFRASICNSFLFYDIDLEMETNLRIHPFCIMEATLKYYKKVKAKDAMPYFMPIIEEVKKVNGTFISLWHNETLSNVGEDIDWRAAYSKLLKNSKS